MSDGDHLSTTARIQAYTTIRRHRALSLCKRCLDHCRIPTHGSCFASWRMDPAIAEQWPIIKTTLPRYPFPSNSERETITTRRLTLRPFNDNSDDLAALHAMRADPEVMRWSHQRTPDVDLEETYSEHLQRFIPPEDSRTLVYAICLKSTREFIGYGGALSCSGSLGWPEVSFGIKLAQWGRGYATEFLEGFLGIWRRLPRETVMTRVHESTVYGDGEIKEECLTGVPTDDNAAGVHALEKSGFEMGVYWDEYNRKSKKEESYHGWVLRRSNVLSH